MPDEGAEDVARQVVDWDGIAVRYHGSGDNTRNDRRYLLNCIGNYSGITEQFQTMVECPKEHFLSRREDGRVDVPAVTIYEIEPERIMGTAAIVVRPEPYDRSRKLILWIACTRTEQRYCGASRTAPHPASRLRFKEKGPGRNGGTPGESCCRFRGMMLIIGVAFTRIFGQSADHFRAPHPV